MIDDAQHLTLKAMGIMRVIHENAKIGIKKYVPAAVPIEDVRGILKEYEISKA